MGKTRRRWSLTEKRRIVELTLEPGASSARVAQAEGVNANQVFQWRRSYLKGDFGACTPTALLPVVIDAGGAVGAETGQVSEIAQVAVEPAYPAHPSGAIRIELPGRATISVECGADRALLRTILESLLS